MEWSRNEDKILLIYERHCFSRGFCTFILLHPGVIGEEDMKKFPVLSIIEIAIWTVNGTRNMSQLGVILQWSNTDVLLIVLVLS